MLEKCVFCCCVCARQPRAVQGSDSDRSAGEKKRRRDIDGVFIVAIVAVNVMCLGMVVLMLGGVVRMRSRNSLA